MREKTFSVVFLMLVLLIGFPSSIVNSNVFADDDKNDKKDDKKESKGYEKQKERAEEAREKAEQKKKELKEKYDEEIKKLQEKVKAQVEKVKEKSDRELEKADEKDKQLKEKEREKIERELKKLEEKAKKLEEKDDDHDDDKIRQFDSSIDVQLSSVTGTGVTICHYPPGNPENAKTLTVGIPAAKAHMAAHGDTMGSCENIRDIDLILEELEAKFAEKQAKLEEKRAELQQKFIEKTQKLIEKFEEKQVKRAEKLLEKIDRGEYYDELIKDEKTLREFVLSFDSLTAEPIGKPSETLEFSGTVTLVTSSSSNTKGTMKFRVTDCEIGNGDISYSCKFGKARTISHGPDGEKNGLVIIATLDDDSRGYPTGLTAFVTTEESINSLEIGDEIDSITMHSPQSKITLKWFLGGEGSLKVTSVISEDDT